jgi:hypothetical protein
MLNREHKHRRGTESDKQSMGCPMTVGTAALVAIELH